MKTLYININNEQIQSNEELEVLNYDLDSDFFFYLGKKIAKGCKVENEIALITDFNTQDNNDGYKQIIAQWNKIKRILFSKEYKGEFKFTIPKGYIHWLKFHSQYVSVYDTNFSQGEPTIITIDLEELYEESVAALYGWISRLLKHGNLCMSIDQIVINDDLITRQSSIATDIKESYNIAYISHFEYKRQKEERLRKELLEKQRKEEERLRKEILEKQLIEEVRLLPEHIDVEKNDYIQTLTELFCIKRIHINFQSETHKQSVINELSKCLNNGKSSDEDIVVPDGFEQSVYTNPSSPFYGGKPGIKVHISKKLKSLFQLFVKFCDYSNTSDHYIISEICDIVCDIDRYINDYKSLQIVKVPYLGGFNKHTKYYYKWRVEVIDNQFRARRI